LKCGCQCRMLPCKTPRPMCSHTLALCFVRRVAYYVDLRRLWIRVVGGLDHKSVGR
jgi:hypothetical protein